MTPVRNAYIDAATVAAILLTDPAVAAAWSAPSALADFSVGGLAAHLASQVLYPARVLATPAPDGETIPLSAHYQRAAWLGADLDADANVAIRTGSESTAAAGPTELIGATSRALEALRTLLDQVPADRVVAPPSGSWTLLLDDHLLTRMMEIAVHSDDLAVSVGIPTPELPDAVMEPVLALLTRISISRHGTIPVLRALSRSERAPATIAAF